MMYWWSTVRLVLNHDRLPNHLYLYTAMRTSFNTVDVRGLRLAAAESKVDQFIKVGIPQNRKVIYILHGHGTGALSYGFDV